MTLWVFPSNIPPPPAVALVTDGTAGTGRWRNSLVVCLCATYLPKRSVRNIGEAGWFLIMYTVWDANQPSTIRNPKHQFNSSLIYWPKQTPFVPAHAWPPFAILMAPVRVSQDLGAWVLPSHYAFVLWFFLQENRSMDTPCHSQNTKPEVFLAKQK